MTLPTASIVMPVHDGERYIDQAIASVLNQSFEDLELIVVDDGSTDGTWAIIEQAARRDSRIRPFRTPHSGSPAVARNYALDRVSGEYLSFLDHDDHAHPDRLACMIRGLESHPEWVAAFHDVQNVRADGTTDGRTRIWSRLSPQQLAAAFVPCGDDWYDCGDRFFVLMALHHHLVHTSSVLIARRRMDGAASRFDTRYRRLEDIDLWFRIALKGRIGYLDRVLTCYRWHDTNITRDRVGLLEDQVVVHGINYSRILPLLSDEEAAAYRARIADSYSDLAYHYSIRDRREDSRAAYRASSRWMPSARNRRGLVMNLLPAPMLRWLRDRLGGAQA
jgi:glycosyltransferase involved in cell wall biosynthesis